MTSKVNTNLNKGNSKLSNTKDSKTITIKKKILCLPLGDYEDPITIDSYTLSKDHFRIVEPAGEAFEAYLDKKLNPDLYNLLDNGLGGLDDDIDLEDEDNIIYDWEKEYRDSKNYSSGFSTEKTIKSDKDKDKDGENYYSLLGLEKEFINATPEEIRKNYKKLALLYHPDKKEINNEKEKEEANKIWVRFQDAYETLTDADKKQKYDSTFKFNEAIPNESVASKIEKFYKDLKYDEIIVNSTINKDEKNDEVNNTSISLKNDKLSEKITEMNKTFFREFGPTFLRNSIWSNKKPVPKIGDMNSDIKKVRRFYNFWYNFSSWRDFEVEGEYNLDEAENRWEKRAMMKENKKLKAAKLKDEKARLKLLVDLAYKSDPRIIMLTKKDEEEKEKLKNARLIERERIKKEKEEKEALLIALGEEKKLKVVELKKRIYSLLKGMLFDESKNFNSKNCFKIFNIDIEKDQVYHIDLNASFNNTVSFFKDLLESILKECKDNSMTSTTDNVPLLLKEYSIITIIYKNNINLLSNNIEIYNGVITDYDLTKLKEYADKEFVSFFSNVICKIPDDESFNNNNVTDKFKVLCSKYFYTKFSNNRSKESSIWTKDEISNLQKANKKFPAGTVNRYEKIMDVVKTKSMNQIIQMSRYISTSPNLKITGDTVDINILLGISKKESKEEPKSENVNTNKNDNSSSNISANTTVSSVNNTSSDEWSEDDQKNLEVALKKYPGSLPANERWTKIASEVPGKNKKQCVERFKHIASLLKKK